jgi:hypothetical protein
MHTVSFLPGKSGQESVLPDMLGLSLGLCWWPQGTDRSWLTQGFQLQHPAPAILGCDSILAVTTTTRGEELCQGAPATLTPIPFLQKGSQAHTGVALTVL